MSSAPTRFIKAGRNEEPVVNLLNGLFDQATRIGASDIHFEDDDEGTVIRFRIGGDLHYIQRIDRQTSLIADAKIRAVCKMSLQERMAAQDGRMFIEVDGRMVDVRVSLLPCRTGQSTVCRLLDQKNAARRLDDVLMTAPVRQAIDAALAEPDGLILMTGPTGSGKTSTLYAMLNELNVPERKIITVEDPVEYRLARAVQVNVNPKLTFAKALRSILRQDPDIILVGEMRDTETAHIGVEAAMTGHLVLSTLHANDGATTITRMTDLGVDAFTLGAVLRCVISQRLAKRLCPHCSHPEELGVNDKAWLSLFAPQYMNAEFWVADGCRECANTGVFGRLPVMELIVADQGVRSATIRNNRNDISIAARKQEQYESLVEAGLRWAQMGQISFYEARRLASNAEYSYEPLLTSSGETDDELLQQAIVREGTPQ